MRLGSKLTGLALLLAMAGTAEAGVADRQKCLDKGNSAAACDCFVAHVDRSVRAGVKPETYESIRKGGGSASDDLTAMGVMIDATASAARACGVKLK